MIERQRDIKFTLKNGKDEVTVETYEGEFRNLMVLINEKMFVEDFGECKGIGRCGTCLIMADGIGEGASVMERNEKSTLSKCAVQQTNLRLSCQLLINSNLQNAHIEIVEDREDVR